MKKIIPFKKEMSFKTNVSEITSISLENTLNNKEQTIQGNLIINGTYKITDTSTQVEEFEFIIPINVEIDNKYITESMTIDINDFYYEIINNNALEVNIEILLDNILEKTIEEAEEKIIEDIEYKKIESQEKDRCIESEYEEKEEIKKDNTPRPEENKNSEIDIFNNFIDESEEYSTYFIYIVREGDSIDTILTKYNITKEKLEEYNDLSEIKIGDKIIISA